MPAFIPFLPSQTNYTLGVPIGDVRYLMPVRWNPRDNAWYFDILNEDKSIICLNIKVVLGVNLGRRSMHEFFKTNMFFAFDTSNQNLDAGYDDLGDRVKVVHVTLDDLTGVTTT